MTTETLLDISKLDRIASLLEANQIPFTRTEEALLCELSIAGKSYAKVYLIPAVSVFPDNLIDGKFSDAFEDIQERILGTEFYASNPKNLYMLIIGEKEFLTQPLSLRAACSVEQNLSYGKKEVLTPEQAVEWLYPPFNRLQGIERVNAHPFLATVAELRQANQPQANLVFDVEAVLQDCEESRHLVRVRTASLFRRIMGGNREVFWADNMPQLGYMGEEDGLEVAFASTGEQITFAFALFLARTSMDITPGMTVGFHASFDRLDAVRQIGCYDCLREFMAATGVNVVVQSAKENLRQLVLRRMQPVLEIVGIKSDDYPRKFY